jgi:hypothetical protein
MDDPQRAIERRSRGRRPIWFGLAFAAGGAVALALGIAFTADEIRLANDGRTATATVVDMWTSHDSDAGTTYHLGYRFTTDDGRDASGTTSVGPEAYGRARAGDTLRVAYLPTDPAVNRPGGVGFQPFPAIFVLALGGVFLLTGVSLTVGSVIGRRKEAALGGRPWPQASPDRTGAYVFKRSAGRFFFDLVGPPVSIGMLVLGGMFVAGQPGGGFALLLVAFFLVVTTSWALSSLRRGLRREVLTVGPQGIWTPESGLLPWPSVRDVRLEQAGMIRYGRVRGATAGYRRLGIWPRRPVEGRGASRAAVGGFLKSVRAMGGPRNVLDVDAIAPFGIYEFELDVPFETVVPAVARFAPVLDERGAFLRPEDEAIWGDRVRPPAAPAVDRRPVAEPPPAAPMPDPDPLATLLASARQPGIFSTPSIVPPEPAPAVSLADAPLDRPVTVARAPRLGLWAAVEIVRSVVFVVLPIVVTMMVVSGIRASAAMPVVLFLLVPVVVVTVFLLVGVQALVAALDRFALARGPREVLTISADGLAIRGRRPIPWTSMAQIRLRRTVLIENGEGGSAMDRPRLVIVPTDRRAMTGVTTIERLRAALGREPGIGVDLDLLDAPPDDVIDLIDRHHRILST